MVLKRPRIALCIGMSLDGKIATRTGHSQWISGPAARKHVHTLRARHQAILTSIETVLADDPRLNVRHVKGNDPLPIILDSRLRIPINAKVLKGKQRVIIVTCTADDRRIAAVSKQADVIVVKKKGKHIDLKDAFRTLAQVGIKDIFVEAGSHLSGALFDEKLVDYVYIFVAPLIIGGHDAKIAVSGKGIDTLGKAARLDRMKVTRLEQDILLEGNIKP